MPKLSIILPIYNVEKYLNKCIESIINQTLDDIEIICIDDKSTDSSLDILKDYAQKDKRIKVITLTKNQGQGIARNIGINLAKGEYLGFVDPDDWIDNEMYQTMYNQAKKLNSDIVICNYLFYKEWNNKIKPAQFYKRAISESKSININIKPKENIDKSIIYQTLLISPCYCWNRIYRTDLIKSNNLRFTSDRCFEDVMFILKTHIIAPSISCVEEPYYTYRLRQTSTLGSYEKRYISLIKVIDEICKYSNSNPIENFSLNIRHFIVTNTAGTYRNIYNKNYRKELLSKIKKYLSQEDFKKLKNKANLSPLQQIFSITNNGSYKIITLLGIQLKISKYKNYK